jgi:hypothetical protein
MQQNSHRFRRHCYAAALLVILGVSGAISTPAPVMAGDAKPARLIALSGPPAEELLAFITPFGYAEPVLVAHTSEGWAAVVFSENPDDLPALIDRLLVEDVHGPGCVPEGAIVCCDLTTEIFVLNTERGWLSFGERCKDPTDDEAGVEVIKVPPTLTQELSACCGIDDEYMDQANSERKARMLWNWSLVTPSNGGELSLPPRTMRGSAASRTSSISLAVTAEACSPIILAHDHSPPSPACLPNRPPSCCTPKRSKRCHETRKHWYVKSETTGEWCHRAGCECC